MAAKKTVKKTAKKTAKKTPATPAKRETAAAGRTSGTQASASAQRAAKSATPARASSGTGVSRVHGGEAASEALVAVAEGDRAPAFALPDQDGAEVSTKSLAGTAYVLYFYPRDNTPGCTREAQGFRDAAAAFTALGVRVIGVSPDSAASHGKFRRDHELQFTLLTDPERSVARAFGAYGPKRAMGRETVGIIRSTFLVDAAGKVRRAWRGVRVDGHVAEVLGAAREL
jgi:peroxiredoxin Q/BCP